MKKKVSKQLTNGLIIGINKVRDEYQRQKELLHAENRVTLPKEALMKVPKPEDDYEIVRIARPPGEEH